MADIRTNVNERIFNISAWHGVNEAPEGEARLKPGEAAVMRNFCVTSGGALKKRPGSRNVAGLLNAWAALVREGSRRLAATDRGVSGEIEMYPRITADETGVVRPDGSPAAVTGENAGEYGGWFFERDGAVWRFDECVRTPGSGLEALEGGRMTPGERVAVASGVERWTKDGGSSFEGPAYLETFDEALVRDGDVEVRGEPTRHDAPAGTDVGFESTDVGGYFVRDGVLYRYYGARVDARVPGFGYGKYACSRTRTGYTYYTESDWTYSYEYVLKQRDVRNGYASYSFNSASGAFAGTGTYWELRAGQSGSVYIGGSDGAARFDVQGRADGTSLVRVYQKLARGPYTGYRDGYSRGDYIGDVTVPEGAYPEAEKGFVFEASFYSEGVAYTVMRSGELCFCYARDQEAGEVSVERAYSFWGIPMEIGADTAEWYGSETYCVAKDLSDTAVRGVWSGFVGGREVLCAACAGTLWELLLEDGVWSRVAAGEMDTSRDVYMFGFDEKLWILNGEKYMVWDGERLREAEGYRPLVSVSVSPEGGGTLLEGINRLTAGRRCRFSPDGEATVYKLPEKDLASIDWVRRVADGQDIEGAAWDLEAGTVTFETAPERGINTLEIAWSAKESLREQVCGMRFAELYNGAQDSRVFLYGDGSNRALYSGIDCDGVPRADYFPDLYEVAVGDANTPVTAMIRHYNRLLAFKADSAWSIGYDTITLVDGTVTAGFTVTPVNRAIGSCAFGQAQLVQNRPRTLDGRSVIEWRATSSSGGITGDQRNAERVSGRVDASIRRFDLARARTFYDKFGHEYYVIGEDGTAICQNLDVDAWYVYTGLDVTCMINYRDELYFGTRDGFLRHFSDRYCSDNGEAIDAYWQSGAMSFSEDFRRKYSATVWIGIKPEKNGYLEVTARTDRGQELAVYSVESANESGVPETERVKLKAKKFTYYRLILRNRTSDRTCTVVSADLRVRGAGVV